MAVNAVHYVPQTPQSSLRPHLLSAVIYLRHPDIPPTSLGTALDPGASACPAISLPSTRCPSRSEPAAECSHRPQEPAAEFRSAQADATRAYTVWLGADLASRLSCRAYGRREPPATSDECSQETHRTQGMKD